MIGQKEPPTKSYSQIHNLIVLEIDIRVNKKN
jgi:hypothetical protein